ncbi:8-oxoguanine deaminase [Ilumatobacter coccineus]|uniref:Putative triazine hydrolase n=1 Tax=Ilumatobacter coccineus (strain NBRC 103263 / KCTC 29153 / YM16-304) TaxID=1313172 RepID=A0A6C7ECE4_ILUCY|nr:8-oxoguanine deaminase [Ilumatobacter coccineus]BAN04151.1 putative triazine hydrolase [Ilumatobacter coccineus YM16-304]
MSDITASEQVADLVIVNARCVATVDAQRREIAGGWVAITDGLVSGVGDGPAPAGRQTIDASDCLVTPGLVNTHHHLYQNLTRAFPPMTDKPLFGWLQSLYPLWRAIDTESVHVSAWVGLAELALSGCTTSSDHLYLHPHGAGDLLTAEIDAATDLGIRFHPTRGSMSLSEKDGGLPPDDVVADDDEILAACEAAVSRHHDPSHGAMTRIALAPCSPFSVTEDLMVRTAELAERLDVRLHTHFAENAEDDEFSLATFGCRPMEYLERTGWCTDRTWVAHCVMPNHDEIQRLGAAGVGAAHCPSSNMILASGIAPVVDLRAAGVKVGLGVDGSSSADAASLWLEARQAMLLAKLRDGADAGTARMALEVATIGGAGCLGREGELGTITVGAVGDIAVWSLTGPSFAGAIADPIEAWLRCGPTGARDTVVAGTPVVRNGMLVSDRLDEMLTAHASFAARIQQL